MPDPEAENAVEDHYRRIAELPESQRLTALDELAAVDPRLAVAVGRRLGFHDLPTVRSEGEPPGPPRTENPTAASGSARTKVIDRRELGAAATPERIGPYRLLSCVGEGAFGSVHAAEQEGDLRRRVAIKILKTGGESSEARLRFESERRALARLEHPGIAAIHDAGHTRDGRPYFVMEFVDGVPITSYCEREGLGIRDRLEQYLLVCRAVAHSHLKGIIHRDLKPANVMVAVEDGRPVPKVIDFGIAKLTDPTDGVAGLATLPGQVIGTPVYMSPEQLEGSGDVDTRADVYSLGTILYELLTGSTPFRPERLQGVGLAEACRLLLEDEPPRPSDRLRAQDPGLPGRPHDAGDWERRLRGDLDWIVMTAIEKDRRRRYDSVSALAADVERCLADQPVVARPPSASYQLGKFARRHRRGLIAATTVALLLLAGTMGTGLGYLEARRAQAEEKRQRDLAERERDAARAVSAFFNEDLLGSMAPESLGYDVTVREALDEAAHRLDGRFADQPFVDASLRLSIGRTYRRLGRVEDGARFIDEAATLAESRLEADDPLVLEAIHEHAESLRYRERYAEAKLRYEKAAERRSALLGPDHPDTLRSMLGIVACESELGDQVAAEGHIRPILERALARLGPGHRLSLELRRGLGLILGDEGRFDEARDILRRASGDAERVLGEGDILAHQLTSDLFTVALRTNDLEEAERLARRGLETRQRKFGSDHPLTAVEKMNLANLMIRKNEFAQAEKLVDESLRIFLRHLGPGSSLTVRARAFLTQVQVHQGRADEAVAACRELDASQEAAGLAGADRTRFLQAMVVLWDSLKRSDESDFYRRRLQALPQAPDSAR